MRSAAARGRWRSRARAVGRGRLFDDDADYRAFERIIDRTHQSRRRDEYWPFRMLIGDHEKKVLDMIKEQAEGPPMPTHDH